MADIWFLRVNVTSVFDTSITTNFYTPNNLYNIIVCAHHFTTIHLHAIFMFAGWAVFINFGIMIDRYFKKQKEKKRCVKIFFYVFLVKKKSNFYLLTDFDLKI
jgi:hypothetical protein